MFMQLFDEAAQAYHKPVWLEINGHAISVYNGQRDAAPAIRFDLKETRVMAAVRGAVSPSPTRGRRTCTCLTCRPRARNPCAHSGRTRRRSRA